MILAALLLCLPLPASAAEPPRTVPEVIEKMEQLDPILGPGDGVEEFNHLYIVTTRILNRYIEEGRFEDPEFMTALGVHFASYYFDAVSKLLTEGGRPAPAWLPLFEHRGRRAIYRNFQFAAAGMEAHICRDLPVTLAALFAKETVYPGRDSRIRRDYRRFNDVLTEAFAELRDELFDGPPWTRAVGYRLTMPLLRSFREKAWRQGRALWKLRNRPRARAEFVRDLDSDTRKAAEVNFLIHFRRRPPAPSLIN